MVFNATFNQISNILWRSVLLVEKAGVPWENYQPVASRWQTLFFTFMLNIIILIFRALNFEIQILNLESILLNFRSSLNTGEMLYRFYTARKVIVDNESVRKYMDVNVLVNTH